MRPGGWGGLLLLAALLFPTVARGGVVGTIFSSPTAADPIAVYWNPAAMTLLDGTQGLAFSGISFIRAEYQRATPNPLDGSAYPTALLNVVKPGPAVGVVTSAGLERFRFGLGMAIPILDGATWDVTYGGKPSSTRYYALNARLLELLIEPAAAFRISKYISVGVGLDIAGMALTQSVYTDFGARINQMACGLATPPAPCSLDAPLVREDPAYDALTNISGMGWGVGVYGGVLFSLPPWLRLGVSVHSGAGKLSIPVEMDVQLPTAVTDFVRKTLPTVTLPELEASGEVVVTSPMHVAVGLLYAPWSALELSADLQWIKKSDLSVLVGNIHQTTSSLIGDQVLIKAFKDEIWVGAMGAYRLLPSLRLALRLEYGPSVRPERYISPVSVDMDKIALHLGVAWQITRRVTAHLEYAHYFTFQQVVRQSHFAPNASPLTPEEEGFDKPSPTGTYSANTDRIGVGMALHF